MCVLNQKTGVQIQIFNGLSHGYGLGIGAIAEGWMLNAVDFWEEHSD